MILCLDYGDRYIGMAAGDPPETPVHRYGMIDQKEQMAFDEIRMIIEKERVQRVLVGVPIGLEGNETEQTHKTLAFMETLREALGAGVEVEGIDETLTSVEAQRILEIENAKPEEEHAEAARIMLADYFRNQ